MLTIVRRLLLRQQGLSLSVDPHLEEKEIRLKDVCRQVFAGAIDLDRRRLDLRVVLDDVYHGLTPLVEDYPLVGVDAVRGLQYPSRHGVHESCLRDGPAAGEGVVEGSRVEPCIRRRCLLEVCHAIHHMHTHVRSLAALPAECRRKQPSPGRL